MTRSKIIAVILAAFCGLAMQFHGSAANAQAAYLPTGTTLYPGDVRCNYDGWCLEMISDSSGFYAGYYDPNGNRVWQSPVVPPTTSLFCAGFPTYDIFYTNAWFSFQTDGNLVLKYNTTENCSFDGSGPTTTAWRTGTTNWNGDPGYLVIIDDYVFGVLDINYNALWLG